MNQWEQETNHSSVISILSFLFEGMEQASKPAVDPWCRQMFNWCKAPFGSHKYGDLKCKKFKISDLWNQTALT
jgi:hypothetical protein